MLVKKVSLFFFLFINLYLLQAQQDTVQLHEVIVQSNTYTNYTHGQKIITIDSSLLKLAGSKQLSYLLSFQPSLFMKSYGNGMLASISLRGTSANHTALLWNGININLPTLGQSDFNLISLSTANSVQIQYGGSSGLIGSDGMGGSINISTNALNWNQPIQLKVQQTIGSFKNYFSQFQFSVSNKKIAYLINFYRLLNENSFDFKNITKPDFPLEQQQNANYSQYGFSQTINYKIKNNQLLSFSTWINDGNRAIQPSMFSNTRTNEKQKDINVRTLLHYQNSHQLVILSLKFSYLNDFILYDNPAIVRSSYRTERMIGIIEQEITRFKNLSFKIGDYINFIRAEAGEYGGSLNENRNDIYLLIDYSILKNLNTSLNLRQPFINSKTTPIAPSVGIDYKLINQSTYNLKLKSTFSKSYRAPTLNERYWKPGGNPSILPEESIGYEFGQETSIKNSSLNNKIEFTYFHYLITNWILWIPLDNLYTPQNIQTVENSGIECSYHLFYSISKTKIRSTVSYSYIQTINKTNSEKNQLPYTPLHSGTLSCFIEHKKWNAFTVSSLNGFRYTSNDNTSFLPGFFLVDLGIGRSLSFSQHSIIQINFTIHNLLNKAYQTYEYKAMPGINYELKLTYQLK